MARTHFKPNKVKALEFITPKFYLDQDISLSGLTVRPESQLINSHILVANSFSSVLDITGLSSIEVVSPYFVKQNKLTNVTPYNFETNILIPLGVTYSTFTTSALFLAYVQNTLLPQLTPNSPTAFSHATLLDELGWFYILNTSGTSYDPSAYVAQTITDLYFGKTLELVDAIKGLETHLWYNYPSYIPTDYVSGTGAYTSGTQQLNKLLTLTDIVYSKLLIDSDDYTVKAAFEDYIATQTLLSDLESKGPFYRMLKAMSYGFQDIDNEIQQINDLYDLERCPDRFLPLIAELIGWHLFGSDPNRWRLQLRNAVELYKAKGTKAALQGAIDSIFSEGFLNLSGDINELFESYIPNLIYYALATESPLFESYSTWTQQIAAGLGVSGYSTQSMDTNIRYAVDAILLSIVKRYNRYFKLNGKQWNLEDPKFRFNYRGRINEIPPFEDIKWYKGTEVDSQLIDVIADKVACFGVTSSFIEPLKTFIKNKTVDSSSLIELDNRWLFFYSGLQLAPNYNRILSQFETNKFKYTGLWSAKSSHFNLNIAASSYNYSNRSTDASSTVVLNEALRAINAFTPAHAIPDINFYLEDADFVAYRSEECETLEPEATDYNVSSPMFTGYFTCAVNMSSLGKNFGRTEVDQFSDLMMSSLSGVSNLPRTSQRRRGLHGILPTRSSYFRTGFNMPVITEPSTTSYVSPPLGFIPSTNSYEVIPNISSIPQVYSKCETLQSTSVYNGIVTSATFPSRGLNPYSVVSCVNYARHGDTERIYGIIANTLYIRELAYWKTYLATSAGNSEFRLSFKDADLATSLANSSINLSSYVYSYEDFEFGPGLHKVYNDWVKHFGRHNISYASLNLSGGKDIFSHVYGPLVYNGKFNYPGSALTTSSQLTTITYNSVYALDNGAGSGVLSILGSDVGTVVLSGPTDNSIHFGNEFRNRHIVSAVELVGTSGASQSNRFVYYDLPGTQGKPSSPNYAVKNPIIKGKSINGFPRLIYRLSSTNNILIPEHAFELDFKFFLGFDSGNKYGGGTVGVWIHTEPESGMVWSYTKNGWVMDVLTSAIQVDDFASKFITCSVPVSVVTDSLVSGYAGQCYDSVNETTIKLTLENITSGLFKTLNMHFDTNNLKIKIPSEYFKLYNQVHRPNQNYVIEVFKLPSQDPASYILFDEVNIKDLTLNTWAEDYNMEDILYLLTQFKQWANSRASRQALTTSGYYALSGGSRINYRENLRWGPAVANSQNQVSSFELNN